MDDVKTDTLLQAINLPDTKTKRERTFVVKGEYLDIVKKYQALRPSNVPTNKLFLNYQNGKCTKQVIGRNKFAGFPKQIATFLELENPENYTGHCFRRTSATLLADSGANLTMLKRHGGWKSDQVAEGYIEQSIENKSRITDRVTQDIHLIPNEPTPSTSRDSLLPSEPSTDQKKEPYPEQSTLNIPSTVMSSSQIQKNTVNMPGKPISFTIQNCSNFTLNFN